MATLPDASTAERPVPHASGGVASYTPRESGMAGQIVSAAGADLENAANIVAETNARQDALGATAAANALNTVRLNLERDPKTGFTNMRGNGVIGQQFLDNYQGQFDTARKQLSDGLTNPLQKRLFQEHAEVIGLQYKSALLQHQAKQTLAFNAQTREDQLQLGLSDIAAHPYDEDTYQTQSLLMGRSVVDAGKEMGLTGDALANFTRAGLAKLQSKALVYRTQGMLLDNPMKAAQFFHEHELDFDPNDRMHLAGVLKTTTDAQKSRVLGAQAFKQAIGTVAGASAPLPANFNADRVQPFNQQYIDLLTGMVAKPSPYDALFQKWGAAYNVSPTELKMRAAVESGLNAKTGNSSQGAIGLMQFMPATAAALGIDPKDPEQAIIGAALLMSRAGGTVGGDMGKVDRVYYGGNPDAKGPNTDQYVENMRTLRQRVMGTAQPTLTQAFLEGREGAVRENARALAELDRPGDLVWQDHVAAEAQKNFANAHAALRGANEKTVSDIMQLFVGPTPPKAIGDLPVELQAAFSQLPGNTQASIQSRMTQGEKKFDPQSAALYYTLLGQAGSDPEAFVKIDLTQHFGQLPDHQWQQLAMMQKSINAKEIAEQQKGLNFSQMHSTVESMLRPLKMGTTAAKGSREAELTDQFYGRLQSAMLDYKTKNDKWPKPEEVQKMGAGLLVQGAQAGTGWFGYSFMEKTPRAYQSEDLSKFYVPLPKASTPEYSAALALFQKSMGKAPDSPSELQRWYTLYKTAGGK